MGYFAGFTFINNNLEYFKNMAGLRQIFDLAIDTFVTADVFVPLLMGTLMTVIDFLKPEKSSHFFKNKKVMGVCLILLITSPIAMPYSADPITTLIRSSFKNFIPERNLLIAKSESKMLLQEIQIESQFSGDKKQNVILIMVESLNARFIGKKSSSGQEWTPFINQLVKKHLYLNNYFSNSIYTSKGHFSALCGQVPMLKKTEYKNDECFKFKCLPDFLKTNEYKTFFAQADPNFNTDNTKRFLLSHGFDYFLELVTSCNKESARCYGLGVKDEIFYNRVLNHMKTEEFKNQTSDSNFFLALATVASHMPFNYLKPEERKFFKDPKDRREHYLNFLKLTDEGLRKFFEEFERSVWSENTIVIITGDHSFPLGEHGNYHNAAYAYQENFDVPLIVYKKTADPVSALKKRFSHLEKTFFSHLNLAPTILDLTSYSGKTDFVADSIFNNKKDSDLYLVQPYGGGIIAIISWPYKYIFSTFRFTESIYNLEKDPGETIRIEATPKLLEELRDKAAQIYKQQDQFTCQ